MKKHFFLYETLYSVSGTMIITLVLWYCTKDYMVPIWLTVSLCIVSFCIVWRLLIELSLKAEPFIEVKRIKADSIIFDTNLKSLLVYNGILSLYKKDDGFERLYGIIKIVNIQEEYIQGEIFLAGEYRVDSLEREKIIIKPMVNFDDLKLLKDREQLFRF